MILLLPQLGFPPYQAGDKSMHAGSLFRKGSQGAMEDRPGKQGGWGWFKHVHLVGYHWGGDQWRIPQTLLRSWRKCVSALNPPPVAERTGSHPSGQGSLEGFSSPTLEGRLQELWRDGTGLLSQLGGQAGSTRLWCWPLRAWERLEEVLPETAGWSYWPGWQRRRLRPQHACASHPPCLDRSPQWRSRRPQRSATRPESQRIPGQEPWRGSSVRWEPGTCSQCAARESCQESSHSHIACFWCWRPEAQAPRAACRTPAPGKAGAAQETGENFTFHLPDMVCAGEVLRTSASL